MVCHTEMSVLILEDIEGAPLQRTGKLEHRQDTRSQPTTPFPRTGTLYPPTPVGPCEGPKKETIKPQRRLWRRSASPLKKPHSFHAWLAGVQALATSCQLEHVRIASWHYAEVPRMLARF